MAIFGDTLFPEDDEASQFDLDIHAIIELADTGQIAVLNHLGSVRIFEPPRSLGPEPVVGPASQRDAAARIRRRRREGDRPRRPPGDVTAPRSSAWAACW